MDSSSSDNQTKNSSEKTVNATSHLPEIENYVTPLNSENFKNISRKLDVIMKLFIMFNIVEVPQPNDKGNVCQYC